MKDFRFFRNRLWGVDHHISHNAEVTTGIYCMLQCLAVKTLNDVFFLFPEILYFCAYIQCVYDAKQKDYKKYVIIFVRRFLIIFILIHKCAHIKI